MVVVRSQEVMVSVDLQANVSRSSDKYHIIPPKRMHELTVKATIQSKERTIELVKTLIDSGCTNTCISKDLVQKENLPTKKLERP